MPHLRIPALSSLRRHAVFNREGRVFIGRRIDGPEHTDDTHVWQMPQGGIDPGEDLAGGAARALRGEPISARSRSSARSRNGSATTFRARSSARPGTASIAGRHRNGTRCASPATSARSNCASRRRPQAGILGWRWEPLENVPELVVPFKRPVYERVVKEFAGFAGRDRTTSYDIKQPKVHLPESRSIAAKRARASERYEWRPRYPALSARFRLLPKRANPAAAPSRRRRSA